jgi:hypothetical protein
MALRPRLATGLPLSKMKKPQAASSAALESEASSFAGIPHRMPKPRSLAPPRQITKAKGERNKEKVEARSVVRNP